jgi:hypothetical protein
MVAAKMPVLIFELVELDRTRKTTQWYREKGPVPISHPIYAYLACYSILKAYCVEVTAQDIAE